MNTIMHLVFGMQAVTQGHMIQIWMLFDEIRDFKHCVFARLFAGIRISPPSGRSRRKCDCILSCARYGDEGAGRNLFDVEIIMISACYTIFQLQKREVFKYNNNRYSNHCGGQISI